MGKLVQVNFETSVALPLDIAIPKGAVLEKVESNYGPLKDPVRCGLCGTPHQRGYVVSFRATEDAPPRQALMGHVCGKREFGNVWTQEVHNLEIRQRLAEIELEFQGFLGSAPLVETRLKRLLPGLEARSEIRKCLTSYAHDFMRRVATIFKSEGGSSRQGDRLQGDIFFLQDNAAQKARLILNGIKIIREMADDSKTTMKDLKEKLSKLQSEIHRIGDIELEAKSGIAALSPSNFARVIMAVGSDAVRMDGTRLWVFGETWVSSRFEKVWIEIADLADATLAT